MPEQTASRPFALVLIAAIYLFSLLLAASNYGSPFPFLGRLYLGGAGEWLVLADSIICLYLVLGIWKRQSFTLWLLIGYNLLDICNACINLALLPVAPYAQLAGKTIPEADLRLNVVAASVLLMLLNGYLFSNRRHFNNKSPYLF
jgi:hypothetical protein